MRGACLLPAALALLLATLLGACRSRPTTDPLYRPTESALEVVALLRLHVPDDTYRFPPARDFTGKNVYRASLNRLEALEAIHAEKFRTGYLADVLLFAKARALERLTEFELAAKHYERVADLETPLRESATQGRDVCRRLAAAGKIQAPAAAAPEEALGVYDERRRQLEQLRGEVAGTHYVHVIDEEIERADRERARHFDGRRLLDPALGALALQQYQRLVREHRESKLRNRHLLDLADLYAELSRSYALRVPPNSLEFDPGVFDEYSFGATRLYEAVSQQDGAVEKIEAQRKLEAFLAFTLQVYDEKIPR